MSLLRLAEVIGSTVTLFLQFVTYCSKLAINAPNAIRDLGADVCSEIPIRRMTSAAGVPVSDCFSAKAICSSVYLDFFIPSSLPEGFTRPER
jgi:hypothetical protein